MDDHWYFAKANTKHGPHSADEIRRLVATGEIVPADLVWKTGMDDWQLAESIPSLFAKSSPPPLPTSGRQENGSQRAGTTALVNGIRERVAQFSPLVAALFSSVSERQRIPRRNIAIGLGCVATLGCCILSVLVGALFQFLTGSSAPTLSDYPPLQAAIEGGNEIWEVRIDQEDDIYHFYVFNSDTLAAHYWAGQGTDGKWSWQDGHGGTARQEFSGRKHDDGHISMRHIRYVTNPGGKKIMDVTTEGSIGDGKYVGEIHISNASGNESITRTSGTAKQVQ